MADGDALVLPTGDWLALLDRASALFPRLSRVSCYAMARNVLDKGEDDLRRLRAAGLSRLYIGPESGDDPTLKRIAKCDDAAAHVEAARRAHAAGIEVSVIALLGIAGERSDEHARATANLVTAMDAPTTARPQTPRARHCSGNGLDRRSAKPPALSCRLDDATRAALSFS